MHPSNAAIHGFTSDSGRGALTATPNSPYSSPGTSSPFLLAPDAKQVLLAVHHDDGFAAIDVIASGSSLVGSPTVPATSIDLGLTTPKRSSVYFIGTTSLHHAPIDKRLAVPIASQTTTLNGIFEDRTTGVIFLAK